MRSGWKSGSSLGSPGSGSSSRSRRRTATGFTRRSLRAGPAEPAGAVDDMRVAVPGGTGVFGSRLAELLVRDGHEELIAARDLRRASALAERLGARAVPGALPAPASRGASPISTSPTRPISAPASPPYRSSGRGRRAAFSGGARPARAAAAAPPASAGEPCDRTRRRRAVPLRRGAARAFGAGSDRALSRLAGWLRFRTRPAAIRDW